MNAVRVLFFGKLAEQVSQAEQQMAIEPGDRAQDIYLRLARDSSLPELTQAPNIKVAVNQELADWDSELRNGDELAFLPPVTGG